MKFFYDTEFIEDGVTVDLVSIGIVGEDGREYYAVSADAPMDRIRKHTWLMTNVIPHLPVIDRSALDAWLKQSRNHYPQPGVDYVEIDRSDTRVKPKWVIANEVRDFLRAGGDPELWAYYGAYDHVVLCQLFGTMMQLPEGMPMFTHELMQLWENAGRPEKPEQGDGQHNALDDARWNASLYNALAAVAW